jgi:SAM-dependent methyltransferase
MAERGSGYVTDVGYTPSYRPGLNPLRSRLALLRAGLEPPAIRTACELGFGQGVSLVVHAAASPVRWWGNDLLPAHVAFAASLNEAAGAPAALAEDTFSEYAARADLPLFDFIGLHGVLSWVSAGNRATIAAFLRERLAPGGLAYAAWNALPGWNDLVPLRALMTARSGTPGTGPTSERIDDALAFAARILAAAPRGAGPGVAARFARLKAADRRYLAHEYFNRDWHPLPFAEVAGLFATAGLRPACPATGSDALEPLHLSCAQQELLAGIGDLALRESVREFLTGTTLRQHYWIREPHPLAGAALEEAWRHERICLLTDPAALPERVSGPAGELRLDGPVFRTLAARLGDHQPATLGELEAELRPAGHGLAALADAVYTLAALDHVATAQPAADAAQARPRTSALNARILAIDPAEGPDVLASPVTGGGVTLDRQTREWLALAAAGATPGEPRATRRLAALRGLGILPG